MLSQSDYCVVRKTTWIRGNKPTSSLRVSPLKPFVSPSLPTGWLKFGDRWARFLDLFFLKPLSEGFCSGIPPFLFLFFKKSLFCSQNAPHHRKSLQVGSKADTLKLHCPLAHAISSILCLTDCNGPSRPLPHHFPR